MYKVLHFLLGYIRIRIGGDGALRYINVLHGEGYSFWGLSVGEDCYLISCSVKQADGLLSRLEALGAEYEVEKRIGLPFAVYPYRRRWGLFVGMLLAMLIVYASSTILWEVRLECNGAYEEAHVRSELKKLGVYDGASIKNINVYEAELGFLINNPEFSDIAVNVQGTVAAVKLRLRTESPRQEPKDEGAYDVVASEAGVIASVSAVKGKPVVKRGDVVDKGDLLISGIMQGAYGEYYIHHAYGSVKAVVYREFAVTVYLQSTEKVYTGKTEQKNAYVILGKSFNVFTDELPHQDKTDVEVSKEKLNVFGVKLPIEKHTVTYKQYKVVPRVLSVNEAEEVARNAFAAYQEREIRGEIINTETECTYDEAAEAVVFKGTVELITEIGTESPMTTFPEQEKPQ